MTFRRDGIPAVLSNTTDSLLVSVTRNQRPSDGNIYFVNKRNAVYERVGGARLEKTVEVLVVSGAPMNWGANALMWK